MVVTTIGKHQIITQYVQNKKRTLYYYARIIVRSYFFPPNREKITLEYIYIYIKSSTLLFYSNKTFKNLLPRKRDRLNAVARANVQKVNRAI